MRKIALMLLLCTGCSLFAGPASPGGQVVIDCAVPAVAQVAAELVPVVTAILEGNAPDWQAMLVALEGVGKDALACALQQVAGKVSVAPGVDASPASKAQQFISVQGWEFK